MGLEWPPDHEPRPRKAKKQKKSSGGGDGTTVGLAWILMLAPSVVIFGSFGIALYLRWFA